MGTHQGWRVTKSPTGSWVGWAWDPGTAKYRTKTHDEHNAAKQWAMNEHARFRVGLDEIRAQAATTRALAMAYVKELRRRGRKPSHLNDVERVLVGDPPDPGRELPLAETPFSQAVTDLANGPLTREQTCDWLSARSQVKPSTRNKYLVYIKGMANWAVIQERLPKNPFLAIETETVPTFLKPQFTMEELFRLANLDRTVWGAEIDLAHPLSRGQRLHPTIKALYAGEAEPMALAILLQIYTGCRAPAELYRLEWDHIDWSGRVVRLFGKRDKERLVPLQEELRDALWNQRKEAGPVVTYRPTNYWEDFQWALERHGIPRAGRSPHSLRHCYAGLMTASGMSALLLQAYMGHTSNDTTGGYAQLSTRYVSASVGWTRGEFRFRQRSSASPQSQMSFLTKG